MYDRFTNPPIPLVEYIQISNEILTGTSHTLEAITVCGIAGLVGIEFPIARARVTEALRQLAHRGPDGSGRHEDGTAVIGMRRLAIIDVARGDQPIYNEDRTIAVVCNGELYNYVEGLRELKQHGHRFRSRSDVNLIPHYYEERGREGFKSIRGMFAAAVWDSSKQLLVLARDRAGKKPLFYAQIGKGLAFASELKALIQLLGLAPAYSRNGLADYLRLGFVPHPETVYEGVFALTPGCTLAFTPGNQPDVAPYWTPSILPTFRGSRADALEALDHHLRTSVSLRLRSDVPVGMLLSGGIDSGLVAAHAREAGARDLLCFVAEVSDPRLNEGPAARATARHLELPIETIHLELAPLEAIDRIPFLYGQPFADYSAIPTYFVARAARQHRKVVLNGDGGDEILGGYRRYWAARAAEWLRPLTAPIRRPLRGFGERLARARERRSSIGFLARTLRGLGSQSDEELYLAWTVDLLSEGDIARCFPELAATGPVLPRLEQLRHETLSSRNLKSWMLTDYRLILADGLLSKMDIATMANSVEARSPLLDVPLTELAWSLPNEWLITPTRTKPLLRDLARKYLPAEIVTAPKRGFEVPMKRWLETDLHDAVHDLLLCPESRVAALGNRTSVRNLVTRHDGFVGNYERMIWSLLMLELFLRAPQKPSPTD